MKSGNKNGVQTSAYPVASLKSPHGSFRRNNDNNNNNNNNVSIVYVIGELSKYISALRHQMGEPSLNTQTTNLFFESMPTLK
jgi:hypothetical protein